MKLLKEWLMIIGIWFAVGLGLLGFIVLDYFQSQKRDSHTFGQHQQSAIRRLSQWHVEQIKEYFEKTDMKPTRWGVSVADVQGATISIDLLTLDSVSKEEAELNLRYMCPPDNARLWYGLNDNNTIFLNVRYPLEPTKSLAWWHCEGPKAHAVVSPTAAVK